MGKSILIAVGGNSLIRSGEKGTAAEQGHNARRTAEAIVGLIGAGHRLVITHGNGPQVGADLLRSERAMDQVPGLPLDLCGAATQGEIGYVLQQALMNEAAAHAIEMRVATIVTQALVAAQDAAIRRPSKPVGPFYSEREANERRRALGWQMVEDAARGYRRVVPSPQPVGIVELEVIRAMAEAGILVIAAGGGGIPVVAADGAYRGVEAVIDKDRASALLASQLGMEVFAISTDVDCVYLDYKTPSQRPLRHATASEMAAHQRAGQFPAGNMGPKIESAMSFLQAGGREVIITSYEHLCDGVEGSAGTHIVPDGASGIPREQEMVQAMEESFRP